MFVLVKRVENNLEKLTKVEKSHLCEVSGATYIWWFDKCHKSWPILGQGRTHGHTDIHTDITHKAA